MISAKWRDGVTANDGVMAAWRAQWLSAENANGSATFGDGGR